MVAKKFLQFKNRHFYFYFLLVLKSSKYFIFDILKLYSKILKFDQFLIVSLNSKFEPVQIEYSEFSSTNTTKNY